MSTHKNCKICGHATARTSSLCSPCEEEVEALAPCETRGEQTGRDAGDDVMHAVWVVLYVGTVAIGTAMALRSVFGL